MPDSDHVFGDLTAGRCRIHAQRQSELNVLPLGEIIQPSQKLRNLLLRDLGEHFREVVNEHMGDIVVAGMQTAEETLEEIVRAQRVCIVAGVDQASLIGNVIRKFFILSMHTTEPDSSRTAVATISTKRFVLPEPLRPMISWTICQSHSF